MTAGHGLADLPLPPSDPEQVRRIADEVLSRPEFLVAQPPWWQELVRRGLEFIGNVLAALSGGGRGPVIGTIVLLAAAAAVIVAVAVFTRRVRRDPRRDAAVPGVVGRSPEDWRREAATAEAREDWRRALRARYRALVADLAAAGVVDEVAGRTTGEYLAAVRSAAPVAEAPFERATRTFESAWYGSAPVEAADLDTFAAAAASVLAATISPAQPPAMAVAGRDLS